jgi:hypothetical protein
MTIPPEVLKLLEAEIAGISHGSVTLTIHLRDGRPRFVISRERSFLTDTKDAGGSAAWGAEFEASGHRE